MTLVKLFCATAFTLLLASLIVWIDEWVIEIIAWIFIGLVVWYCIALLIGTGNEEAARKYQMLGDFASSISKLGVDQWNAMGFHFPILRFKLFKGQVLELFEDTKATRAQFIHFLKTSDRAQISPERYWNTSEYPRWAWQEIKTWLETNDPPYIYKDSAAGNHSWLWRGNAHAHLCAYWLVNGLPNMEEVEGGGGMWYADEQTA